MSPKSDDTDRRMLLSKRQQHVADLVCQGLSNKMIARKLGVSEGTIKSHLNSIYKTLGVKSRYALMLALDRNKSD